MFKTLFTTLRKLAVLKAAVRTCILYSTNVPVHLHLHLFKVTVALEDNDMHSFFQCSHSREDILETWTRFLSTPTRFKNKSLSLLNETITITKSIITS